MSDSGQSKQEVRLEVVKHSAAIQIHNNITLLQRRAWNVLLYHAYNDLPTDEVHYIPLRVLEKILDYDSHNEEYLKEALRALVGCTVEWNTLNKDGKIQWGVASLLAQAKIENGICSYAYAPEIRQRLYNPAMYARLDLSLQNKFESKYTQALWELCADYLGSGREQGETPFIPVERFRKLLGITEGMYPSFKKLNQKVLGPAVAEINRVSDFHVTVDYQRQGRKITALKFKVRRVQMLPHSQQPNLFPDLKDMPIGVKLLNEAGLSMQEAFEIWQKGFSYVVPAKRPALNREDREEAFTLYIREKVNLLEQRTKQGIVEHPTGFLLTALQQNYPNVGFEREEAAKVKARKMRELKSLEQQKEKVRAQQDEALQRMTDQIVSESPELADMAIEVLRGERNFIISRFGDAGKSGMENYRSGRTIANTIGTWLEKQFPEKYEKIFQQYHEKLNTIEARIKALEAEGVKVPAYRR